MKLFTQILSCYPQKVAKKRYLIDFQRCMAITNFEDEGLTTLGSLYIYISKSKYRGK